MQSHIYYYGWWWREFTVYLSLLWAVVVCQLAFTGKPRGPCCAATYQWSAWQREPKFNAKNTSYDSDCTYLRWFGRLWFYLLAEREGGSPDGVAGTKEGSFRLVDAGACTDGGSGGSRTKAEWEAEGDMQFSNIVLSEGRSGWWCGRKLL